MISQFLRELKRRRVLRTASLYVLGSWIALQVVEVLSEAGLPPGTMRSLLVFLTIGFPVALVIGWFYDITAEGIHKTEPLAENEQLPELKFFDHVLLVGLVLVMAIDTYILSFPPPGDFDIQKQGNRQHVVAVLHFDDIDLKEGSDPVGSALAGELRSSLTRTAGLRVLGPETSRVIYGEEGINLAIAKELMVMALLAGEVLLDGSRIRIDARLIGVPNGNDLWTSRLEGPVKDAVSLQQQLIRQVIAQVAPTLDPDPLQGPRSEVGDCADVYELYLRGKQLTEFSSLNSETRQRGLEMLREAVSIDDQCAMAWESLAMGYVDWSVPGFARAGAAARRALELNDALPGAWTVLAEIAEEEERWGDSEEYFLRALFADPTHVHANEMYSEALLARGRVGEGLRHALEAVRYEPASGAVAFHVSLAAKLAGDADLTLEYAAVMESLTPEGKPNHPWVADQRAEGELMKGDTEQALEHYRELGERIAPWFPACVRAHGTDHMPEEVLLGMRETLSKYKAGELSRLQGYWWIWQLIRCSTWAGEADVVLELLFDENENFPTETRYIPIFFQDATVLRQHPRFKERALKSGLVEYWREWGWSDYCETDDEGFRCD